MILKFWTPKKLSIRILMVLLFSGPASFAAAQTAYDDFSGPLMDDQKWTRPEYVRETVNGKLLIKVANAVNLSYTPRVSNNIIHPSSVHSIECFITVTGTSSIDTGDNGESAGRIEGFFYNTQAAGGATGDVWAAVKIGNRGSGLEAWWEISESLNDGLTEFNEVSSNTIIPIGELSYDTAYRAKISYDGNRGFTFEVNGSSDSYSGPERQRNAVTGFKAISAIAYGTAGNGYASVLFDDVTINGGPSVYDDFSSQLIDTGKWTTTESVRECPNGSLRLNIRGLGQNMTNDANLVERDASYLKAKVRIDGSSLISNGAYGVARIQGYYYNDGRGPGSGQDYNKYIGDVFAQVRLHYESDGSMSARVYVDRCNDTNETNYTSLFSHTFSTPIALDTDYALSIDYRDNKLIFSCEGEMVEYRITTPSYPPYGLHRLLRSRVYLDPGETGYMKAVFDDVSTEKESSTSNLSRTQISQLYVSIFNRASEGEGNAFWRSLPDMATAAAAMLDTDAAKNYFGSSLDTDQAFIEHIYLNTLNKSLAEDPGGIAYWVGLLSQGYTRGQVVAFLVGVIGDYAPGGPSYNPNDAVTIAAYNQFTNRVEVSNYMADTVQGTPIGWETVTAFSSGLIVTDDPATVTAAKAMVDLF